MINDMKNTWHTRKALKKANPKMSLSEFAKIEKPIFIKLMTLEEYLKSRYFDKLEIKAQEGL